MRTLAHMLWFDVEKRYNTTDQQQHRHASTLWFDVEKQYNTTYESIKESKRMLWFDVEKRYNTTRTHAQHPCQCCGLM